MMEFDVLDAPDHTTLFDQLGGEPPLRAIISDFIDRVFADVMIGFFFVGADRARIKEKEYELAASQLGADIDYTGRGLPEVHRKHPILGGHFQRRLHILRQTLEDHDVPKAVAEHWLEHTERMRGAITRDAGSDCNHDANAVTEPRRLPLAFAAMVKNEPGADELPRRRELPLVGPKKGGEGP